MYKKLLITEAEGNSIKTGIVGAGQMGRGMVSQMTLMNGIVPAIVSDINIQKVLNAFEYAGIKRDDVVIADTLSEANVAIETGKFVATQNSELVSKADLIQVVVDATGVPDVGAKVATDTIENGKHIVMLNVETDIVIGPYLNYLAKKNGVLYTGSAGDEPGAVMELYDFAVSMGMEVKVLGKGKNNALDKESTPDSVLEEATRRKMSPKMLCAFKDGTKTMVELCAMSNATGLIPDTLGARGPKTASGTEGVKELNEIFKLKSEGGILEKHGVVEYVNGIAPGVFVTVSTPNDEIAYQMGYHSMGSGPLWTLYRPYHLCNLETPLTVAKLVLDNETAIVPIGGLVSECITVAKRDLKAGELIDGIGGYTTYGLIATKEESDTSGYVPFGLVNKNTKMLRDVKKGEILTSDDVLLDTNTLLYELRKKQDSMSF